MGIAECKIPGGGERDQEKSERGRGRESERGPIERCDKERERSEEGREGGEREKERETEGILGIMECKNSREEGERATEVNR